ncbi:MAG TPA: hypothetical protein VGA49_00370 [Patescibacteria group bacterium]
MTIFVDFDHTLFNATLFKEKLYDVLSYTGFGKEEFFEIYNQVQSEDGWNDYKLIKALKSKKDFDENKALISLRALIQSTSDYLYLDAVSFLNLFQNKARLILVSWGDPNIQKDKVLNSGLMKYFDKTIFTSQKKYSLLADYLDKDSVNFFINDNPLENQEVAKIYPDMKILTIKREDGKEYQANDYENLKTLTDLQTISDVINKNL